MRLKHEEAGEAAHPVDPIQARYHGVSLTCWAGLGQGECLFLQKAFTTEDTEEHRGTTLVYCIFDSWI